MSAVPVIRPHALAPAGSLGGDVVRGDAGATGLLAAYRGEAGGGARDDAPAKEAGPAGGGAGPARGGALPPEAIRATDHASAEKLQEILEGGGSLVLTGQQPVLFTGPPYVLYKAITAVRAAEAVEEATGRPCLAAFWISGDDHDWEEVGGTRLLDRGNELRELRLDPPPAWSRRSAGPAPLPREITDLLSDLTEVLPQSEFIDFYLELFQDAYRPRRPLGEAFGAALAALLEDRPLALVAGWHPAVKRAARPVLRRALHRAERAREAVETATRRVRRAGYEPQIPLLEGTSDVFYDTGEARERLYVEGERVRVGRDGPERPLEAVLRELEEEPERFSPNVALLPVVASALLPVRETVLGPGELAYWAQLPELFEAHGVAPPRVRPRDGWVVLEEKVLKVLEKVGAEPGLLADGGEALVRGVVEKGRPRAVRAALGALRAAAGRALAEVEEATEAELPGIRASVGKARSAVFGAVAELEDAVDRRVEERQDVLVRQIRKAAVHLYPGGAPQERVLNPLYYLARYGRGFVDAVDAAGREREAGGGPPPVERRT